MGHSHPALNPNGGAGVRRASMQPALHDDLMVRVMEPANLRRAWKRVKANRGAPGVDGVTVDEFPAFAKAHWPAIRRAQPCSMAAIDRRRCVGSTSRSRKAKGCACWGSRPSPIG